MFKGKRVKEKGQGKSHLKFLETEFLSGSGSLKNQIVSHVTLISTFIINSLSIVIDAGHYLKADTDSIIILSFVP